MTLKKVLGYLLISIPFITIYIFMYIQSGLKFIAIVTVLFVIIIGLITFGVKLTHADN